MGQKVNPKSFRLGIISTWPSRWFAAKGAYAKNLHMDLKLRKLVKEKLKKGGVTSIEIERSANKTTINVSAAKPGVIIGRNGSGIEDLKDWLYKTFRENIDVNVLEVPQPDLSAVLIGESVAEQIQRRIAYRRAAKGAIKKAMEAGAQGVKIQVSGRLNGVEIARLEIFREGRAPLHTLRANIDYAQTVAKTTYGVIGIKVWVYTGLVFKKGAHKKAA